MMSVFPKLDANQQKSADPASQSTVARAEPGVIQRQRAGGRAGPKWYAIASASSVTTVSAGQRSQRNRCSVSAESRRNDITIGSTIIAGDRDAAADHRPEGEQIRGDVQSEKASGLLLPERQAETGDERPHPLGGGPDRGQDADHGLDGQCPGRARGQPRDQPGDGGAHVVGEPAGEAVDLVAHVIGIGEQPVA